MESLFNYIWKEIKTGHSEWNNCSTASSTCLQNITFHSGIKEAETSGFFCRPTFGQGFRLKVRCRLDKDFRTNIQRNNIVSQDYASPCPTPVTKRNEKGILMFSHVTRPDFTLSNYLAKLCKILCVLCESSTLRKNLVGDSRLSLIVWGLLRAHAFFLVHFSQFLCKLCSSSSWCNLTWKFPGFRPRRIFQVDNIVWQGWCVVLVNKTSHLENMWPQFRKFWSLTCHSEASPTTIYGKWVIQQKKELY